MHDSELLMSQAYDEGVVTEVIRPAAVVPEEAARAILMQLALRDVRLGGLWDTEPALWRRFDRSWEGNGAPGGAQLLGTIQVAYGTPTRYEITIYRVTMTRVGTEQGWTVRRCATRRWSSATWTCRELPAGDPELAPETVPLPGLAGEHLHDQHRGCLLLDGGRPPARVGVDPEHEAVGARLGPLVRHLVGVGERASWLGGGRAAAFLQRAGADPVALDRRGSAMGRHRRGHHRAEGLSERGAHLHGLRVGQVN